MKKLNVILLIILSVNLYGQTNKGEMAKGLKIVKTLFDSTLNEKVSCYRIPSMVTAPNGDIVCAIDERVPSCADLRGNDNINIVMRRSSDNGKTWTSLQTVVDLPKGESASDPSMIVDKETNEIFLFYNYMNLDKDKKEYRYQFVKSSDNGKSWTKPKDISEQISKPEWKENFKFITSGRGIQTKSGKLLHCVVNLQNGGRVFASDDHGKTWYLIDTKITPFDESKIVELADGKLMINSRIAKQGYRIVHISDDGGKTWKTHQETQLPDPGCNASIIRYTSKKHKVKDKILIFANNNDSKFRQNMTVRISRDDGKTWSKGKTVYSGSSAYPTLTVLKNGDIGLLFEADRYTKNVFVSFPLKWIEK